MHTHAHTRPAPLNQPGRSASYTTVMRTRASPTTTPTPPKPSARAASCTTSTLRGTSAPERLTRCTCVHLAPGQPTPSSWPTEALTGLHWPLHGVRLIGQVNDRMRVTCAQISMRACAGAEAVSSGCLRTEKGQYGSEAPPPPPVNCAHPPCPPKPYSKPWSCSQ